MIHCTGGNAALPCPCNCFEGVVTTRMPTQGWHCSTTTTVAFNSVRVPVANIIGKVNQGFLPIMKNFSNERFSMGVQANRMSRIMLDA